MIFYGFDMLPFELDRSPTYHDSELYITTDNKRRTHPVYEWKVEIGDVSVKVEKGREPNMFNRFMQRLVMGYRWSKI